MCCATKNRFACYGKTAQGHLTSRRELERGERGLSSSHDYALRA